MANYATNSIGYDLSFELNEFNEPRLKSELELIKDVILYVLFAKPGQYPSLPMIGMDIARRLYSHYDELDPDELKDELIAQCKALGTYIDSGMVSIIKTKYHDQPSLLIHIEGKEKFPDGYMSDKVGNSAQYLIGITFDELDQMVYNINRREI